MTLAVPGGRAQALLAYLALCRDRAAARTQLAALLWPDRGEDQARASLRQELSALRKLLPQGALLADRSTVRLADTVAVVPAEGAAPLLEGFDPVSPALEDWLAEARRADAAARTLACLGAGGAALAAGDGGRAAALAGVALTLDPYDERAMQLALRAAEATGERLAALDAYGRFCTLLRDELGAAPEAATAALADRLRQGAGAQPAPPPRPDADPATLPTIAVLAFEDLSAAPPDMFAAGIVEEITTALSRVHEFRVIARQSAFALRGLAMDAPEAAARLGADYLVEGSVRRAGDRVRIAVQLIRGRDGHTLWANRFDDRIDDLFDLQDRIAGLVAGQVSPHLRLAEIARAGTRPPADRTSYDLMLTAFPQFWSHTRADNARAVALLTQAVDRDPANAYAMAMLAWAHAQQPSYMWSADPEGDRARALDLAERAAGLVTDHAPTLTAIGAAISITSADIGRASSFIDRAIAIDPSNAWAWMRRGWARAYVGDVAGACDAIDRAERLSPLDPFRFNMVLARASVLCFWTDRCDEAIALAEEAARLNPRAHWIWRMLAGMYFYKGDLEATRAAGARLLEHYPDLTIEYLQRSLPPAAFFVRKRYRDSFRAAGVPER